jgi:hypothetical protein
MLPASADGLPETLQLYRRVARAEPPLARKYNGRRCRRFVDLTVRFENRCLR